MNLVSESEDPLVIPFLLNLSSMSDLMASTVINVSSELINDNMAEKIANLLPIWYAKDIILSKVILKAESTYLPWPPLGLTQDGCEI